MIDFLFFLTLKIPLIFTISIVVLYLIYLKNTHEIVSAQCIESIKCQSKCGYNTTYRYFSIQDNLIEQIDKQLISLFPKTPTKTYKLLIAKRNQNIAKQFNKTISICTTMIIMSIIIVIFG